MKLLTIKKYFFHKQNLLLIPSFIFFWYSIDSFYSYSLGIDDLIPHKGRLIKIEYSQKNIGNEVKKPILLKLSTESNHDFKLMFSSESKSYDKLISYLKLGEELVVFTEPLLFGKTLNRKANNTILIIKKGEREVIQYFELSKNVSFNMMIVSLPIFIIFFSLFLIKLNRRISCN